MMKKSFCVFVFIAFLHVFVSAQPEQTAKRILILHSFHREYNWTEHLHQGIVGTLEQDRNTAEIATEYLDWIRVPDPALLEVKINELIIKYADRQPDIIITSDLKALESAIHIRRELNSSCPIVFTGVSADNFAAIEQVQPLTGVYYDPDIEGTLKIARNIQKNARRLILIHDMSPPCMTLARRAQETVSIMREAMTVAHANIANPDTVRSLVSQATSRDIILVTLQDRCNFAKGSPYDILLQDIYRISPVPVWILSSFQLGSGAMGGSLITPGETGKTAATLALRILDGHSMGTEPPLEGVGRQAIFDYHTLKRFRINQAMIPLDASFIHSEQSFIFRYQNELIFATISFVLMLVFMDILFLSFRRERKLSRHLASQNTEIRNLNEHLTRSAAELAKNEELYRLAATGSNDAIWSWSREHNEIEVSDRWEEITGYEYKKLGPKEFEGLVHQDDFGEYRKVLERHLHKQTDKFSQEIRIKTASGYWKWVYIRGKGVWDEQGNLQRLAGSITDIDERRQKETVIENLAYRDQLTMLPNRTSAVEKVRLLEEATTSDSAIGRAALILLDIDNFKYVNDTYGHRTGDKILIRFARYLKSYSSDRVFVFRFGGDEFCLFTENMEREEIEDMLERILKLLGGRLEIDGKFHYLTISAGVAMRPEHGLLFDDLLQHADAALHQAKQTGKTRSVFFDAAIKTKLNLRMDLDVGLRSAIENGELFVQYQPQINLKTHRMEGMEALVRWDSPGKGRVSPAEFIPIAEESGQIRKIGFFVLQNAARLLKRAHRLGLPHFTVSVNVSVKQLLDPQFVDDIVSLSQTEDINPSHVHLEITESFLIEALELMVEKLNKLRQAGFSISLDDFGKGYSSLSYLKALPVDTIKIDKLFIDDITQDPASARLVKTIINLSHELGHTVVAEGVEDKLQVDYLSEIQCDYIQGYYYSKPLDETDILDKLEQIFQ